MSRLAFGHVGLNCRDMRVTERFYVRHLGFTRARVLPLGDQEIVFLRNGDMLLELFQASDDDPCQPIGADGPTAPGVRHIAFQTDDVDAILASMGAAADVSLGPLSFDDFIPGWRTVWVRDPDGVIVEITQGYVDQDPLPEPV